MKYWSSQQNSFIYQKRLQQKYTTKEYWLMRSTERMDPNAQYLSNLTLHDLHFSFNFGIIYKDPRFINNKESY